MNYWDVLKAKLARVSVKWAIKDSVTQNTSAPKMNYFQKQNWRVSWRADHCTSSAAHYFQQLRASYWEMNELLQDSLRNCFIMRIAGHKVSMMVSSSVIKIDHKIINLLSCKDIIQSFSVFDHERPWL